MKGPVTAQSSSKDPFGSVDAPTAAWILEELLSGPMLKDRARMVVLQPETDSWPNLESMDSAQQRKPVE